MTLIEFSLLLGLTAFVAGTVGALTGLGGGVILVPVLTLAFKVDIRYAIGASLISVIATSSGAASAYVREGYTNLRIGMFLEIATTFGALIGAFLAVWIAPSAVGILFGIVLIYSSYMSVRAQSDISSTGITHPLAETLKLNSTYPTPEGLQAYQVHAVPFGFAMMFLAGTISGLLGIGSGAFKVLAMDRVMRIPFKVSTTTSNFMIGVTAAASAGIYFSRGYMDPGLAAPVMLGVLAGSMLGARILFRAATGFLRKLFAIVIFVLALEMIYNSVAGRL